MEPFFLKKERLIWMDVVRSIAILLIILCHAVEAVFPMTLENWKEIDFYSRLFRQITFTIGRCGVPLFLFLSAYLVLNKDFNSREAIQRFYKNNLIPLFIATELWIVIYNFFLAFLDIVPFDLKTFITTVFQMKQIGMGHMWYMPMILGMYVAVPFLSKLLKTVSIQDLKIPLLVTIFTSYCFISGIRIFSKIDTSFLGGIYGVYLVIGYYCSKGLLENIAFKKLFLISLISFIIVCAEQIGSFVLGRIYNVWYNDIWLFLCTLFFFEMIRRQGNIGNQLIIRITNYISRRSLSMFFLHFPIVILLQHYNQPFIEGGVNR